MSRFLTPRALALPATVPFTGPETLERRGHLTFRARLGANESAFGPSPLALSAMRAAVEDPDLRARFEEYGMQAEYQTGPRLGALLAAEITLWGNLIREAGIRAE